MTVSQDPDFESLPAAVTNCPGRVVVLHGLGGSRWLTWLLARRLEASGYEVEHWGYGSVGQTLPRLIDRFQRKFRNLQESLPDETPLHVVGHSLGSIIARVVLSQDEFPSLKRFVMLSPPNCGSHVASLLGPKLKWLTDLVDELADRPDSMINRLPGDLRAEVGVIAAEWDYVVKLPSTHLPCEADHIVMPSRHTGLVFRRAVAEQILHFLDYGRFHRPDCHICAESRTPART